MLWDSVFINCETTRARRSNLRHWSAPGCPRRARRGPGHGEGPRGAPPAVFAARLRGVDGVAHLRELHTKLKAVWPPVIRGRPRGAARGTSAQRTASCPGSPRGEGGGAEVAERGPDAVRCPAPGAQRPVSVGRAAAAAPCLLHAAPFCPHRGGDPAIDRASPRRHGTESIILVYFNL